MKPLFILFFLILFKSIVNSYTPEENDCLVNLLTKLEVLSQFPPTLNGNTSIDFCSFKNFSCAYSLGGVREITCTDCKISAIRTKVNVRYFTLNLIEPINEKILFSYLTGCSQVEIHPSNNNPNNSVEIENDFPPSMDLSFPILNIGAIVRSIPSFINISIPIIFYTIGQPFNYNSLKNFSTHSNIPQVGILSENNTIPLFPFPVDVQKMIKPNNLLYPNGYFSSTILFEKPIDYYDLGNSTEFGPVYVALCGVGPYFNIDGNFPFKSFHPSVKSFYFQDGNISTVPNFDNVNDALQLVSLTKNKIGGTLKKSWNNKYLRNFELSNNNITGTIDDSYCSTMLIVANNSMSGILPKCYSCNLGIERFRNSFIGNNFSNINSLNETCKTIPNMKSFKVEVELSGVNYTITKLLIFGQNLGYSVMEAGYSETFELNPGLSLITEIQNSAISSYFYNNARTIYSLTYLLRNQTFYLCPDPYQPTPINATSNNGLITIQGIYFSYNVSVISITMNSGKQICNVVGDPTFYTIQCSLSAYPTPSNNVSTILRVDELETLFYIDLDDTIVNYYNTCIDYCNIDNGVCNYSTGKCTCNYGWTGDNCSIVYFECPNNCSNAGICNTTNGECTCNDGRVFNNCSGYQCLDPSCGSGDIKHGQCNYIDGTCECNLYWLGENCTLTNHYVSSVEPSTTLGGLVTLFGSFGNVHKGLSIKIGKLECNPILSNTSDTIKCIIGAGKGVQNITVIQNDVTWIGINQYLYTNNKTKPNCFNNCTNPSQGICGSNGQCQCFSEWTGFDCSSPNNNNNNGGSSGGGGDLPSTNSTINDNGSTNIDNQKTSYQILVTSLSEIDFNGNIVSTHPLENNWIANNTQIINGVAHFTQLVNETNCRVNMTIEELSQTKDISFAGIDLQFEKGTIKVSISIENYDYKNILNTLQLRMKSSVTTLSQESDCNDESTEISSNLENTDTLNYISISKDKKVLTGRFLNRVVSDGRSTMISNSLISNDNSSIEIGLNLPHCVNQCLIDPDFSVLIAPQFKSCGKNDSRKSYIIPVSVVCGFIGISLIVAGSYLIYRKRFIENDLNKKLKLNNVVMKKTK
ncbi:hypothetical protein RB653_007340 [Dictyostelium firmibasis]|uniref:EGF-like domain-containing protein n=1 Tax=Dictyostelium firmibasis TaxID=79012 RepID=A0AAN7YLZ2_9MYCE